MKARFMAFAATLLFSSGTAGATDYCSASYTRICDGCTATIHWKITNAKIERVKLMGDERKSKWCTTSWRSLGGHNIITMTTPPRFGKVEISSYSVSYTSDKTGTDRFVTNHQWLDPYGKRRAGTVIYEIEVVDHTL